jgi:hypothetical protein
MISDIASVYDSSSITFFGRLMRFGGGGISWESFERFVSAVDLAGTRAMVNIRVAYAQKRESFVFDFRHCTRRLRAESLNLIA